MKSGSQIKNSVKMHPYRSPTSFCAFDSICPADISGGSDALAYDDAIHADNSAWRGGSFAG
jgi:hypothetical protein